MDLSEKKKQWRLLNPWCVRDIFPIISFTRNGPVTIYEFQIN